MDVSSIIDLKTTVIAVFIFGKDCYGVLNWAMSDRKKRVSNYTEQHISKYN